MRRLNPTLLALLGGVVILLLIIAYFATNRNSEQDKLTGNAVLSNEVAATRAAPPEKRCATQATYDLIKRELFRRAAQQRVAVARALANKPPLILADEPTGNLDEHTADIVFAEFLNLVRGEGCAALVATHNERIARKMDRVVRLHEGRLE